MSSRPLILRRDDRCVVCDLGVAAGTRARWDAATRAVTCESCAARVMDEPPGPEVLDRGTAGASAGREHDRRKTGREARIRSAHPRLGSVMLGLSDEPQHQRAWDQGRRGEEAVAEALERRTAESPTVLLHDRRLPRSRANVDHIAIAPSGLYVIDTKDVTGRVTVHTPLFGRPKLLVQGRDRTTLIDGLDRQVAAITEVLVGKDVPVRGVLCFTRADLPLLGTTQVRGHLLLRRKALAKRLNADGPLGAAEIEALARRIAAAMPAA